MSWWSSSEIESQILRATSRSIPTGEQDLPLNLEISDSVRSKNANAKDVLRVLRKRLYDVNPNVQILCLHLLDLLAKNGGTHFLVELTSKEFIDGYVAQLLTLVNQNRNPEVVGLMLDYFQTWALASQGRADAAYLHHRYKELKQRRDIEFSEPSNSGEISNSFLESATAPEWTDSDTCMKSGQPFSFYNRKHHCRNCGGVFFQEYCSHMRALPHFGINVPVRVCDNCNDKLNRKYTSTESNLTTNGTNINVKSNGVRTVSSNNSAIGSRYQQDIDKAINLSLKGSTGVPVESAAGGDNLEDEELERAIRESLLLTQNNSKVETAPTTAQTTAQSTGQSLQSTGMKFVPSEPPKPQPAFPERGIIDEFARGVQTAAPHEAVYNQSLIDLSRAAVQLQPKVISELRMATNKYATLEDLHGKLLKMVRLYDDLLERELNPDYVPNVPTNVYSHQPATQQTQPVQPATQPVASQPVMSQPVSQPPVSQPTSQQVCQPATPVSQPSESQLSLSAHEPAHEPTQPAQPAQPAQHIQPAQSIQPAQPSQPTEKHTEQRALQQEEEEEEEEAMLIEL